MYNLGKWVILITEKKKLLVSWSVIQCDGRWVSTPWTNLSAKLYDYLHTWKNYDHNILKFGCHLIIHSGMAAELYGARKCSVCSLQCLDTCSYSAVSIFRIVSWFINFLFHMSCWPKPGWIPHSSSLAVLNKVPWKLQIYIYIYKHTHTHTWTSFPPSHLRQFGLLSFTLGVSVLACIVILCPNNKT